MSPSPRNLIVGTFPQTRLRRNRQQSWVRNLVSENTLQVSDLIWPVFVREECVEEAVKGLPGVKRYLVEDLIKEVETLMPLGIQSLMLFPIIAPEKRTEDACEAFNEDGGLLCRAVRTLKSHFPDLGIITDVALDPYTSHGQDGLVIDGEIHNDETLRALEKHALVQARAGADCIAPSEMMDGRVGAIRKALDEDGYQDVSIMSYAAKYASCFYGPFREALKSDACLGKADKKTYQLNPANINEAMREVAMDIHEGADTIIVKPGMPYLDVVHLIKDVFKMPTIAFQVSAEYAMLHHAAKAGAFDYDEALLESLMCFKRAGSDGIITYAAPYVAQLLSGQNPNTEGCAGGQKSA